MVDNASHDGSEAALAERHPGVTVIVNPDNYGFAGEQHRLRRRPRQRLCLVNTDVIALDGAVDRLWSYLQQHPGSGPWVPDPERGRPGPPQRQALPQPANALGDHLC